MCRLLSSRGTDCAGVLQIEAMAQLAGICMLDPEAEKKDQFFFGGIENCRWRKPVVPGDTLVRSCHMTSAVMLCRCRLLMHACRYDSFLCYVLTSAKVCVVSS